MNWNRWITLVVLPLCVSCNIRPTQYPQGLPNGPGLVPMSGPNVIPMSVNGTYCDASQSQGYINKPCVSLKICATNNASQCVTVNDMLVDTGSVGIRIFASRLSGVSLTKETVLQNNTTYTYGECIAFGDSSKNWGYLAKANVILGQEPATLMDIQVIDPTFAGSLSQECSGANASAASAGYNGILGVGLALTDNSAYFSCNETTQTCTSTNAISLPNPVSQLNQDNNGVILKLPMIPFGGQASADGYLVLGIDTQSNNAPAHAVEVFNTTSSGFFKATLNSTSFTRSFIDSGTNTYGVPQVASLPICSGLPGNFLCPSALVQLQPTVIGWNSGSFSGNSQLLSTYVDNANTLFGSPNNVYLEVGTLIGLANAYDFGLPFFFGRNVYVGFQGFAATGFSSGSVNGPFWAF